MSKLIADILEKTGRGIGEFKPVTEEIAEEFLNQCVYAIHTMEPGSIIEIANMLVRKNNEDYSVYMKIGEFK